MSEGDSWHSVQGEIAALTSAIRQIGVARKEELMLSPSSTRSFSVNGYQVAGHTLSTNQR